MDITINLVLGFMASAIIANGVPLSNDNTTWYPPEFVGSVRFFHLRSWACIKADMTEYIIPRTDKISIANRLISAHNNDTMAEHVTAIELGEGEIVRSSEGVDYICDPVVVILAGSAIHPSDGTEPLISITCPIADGRRGRFVVTPWTSREDQTIDLSGNQGFLYKLSYKPFVPVRRCPSIASSIVDPNGKVTGGNGELPIRACRGLEPPNGMNIIGWCEGQRNEYKLCYIVNS